MLTTNLIRFRMSVPSIAVFLVLFGTFTEDSRASGLSNEIFLNKQWRDLESAYSIISNPSFGAIIDWPRLSTCVSTTQFGRFYLLNSQFTLPLRSSASMSHTIGLAYNGFNAGEIETTYWRGSQIVVGEKKGYAEHYGTLNYAFKPIPYLAIGANANIGRQTNFDLPVTDGSLDFGVSFLFNSLQLGSHLIGIHFLNPARLTRHDIPLFTPNAGISWHFSKQIRTFTFEGGFDADYRSFRGGDVFGNRQRDFTGRLGMSVSNLVTCFLQGSKRYIGFSARLDIDSSMARLPVPLKKVTGAFQTLFTEQQIRPTNSLYFSGLFFRHRDALTGDEFDLYTRARKAFAAERYWEAYALLRIISHDYPKFVKIDEARCLAGKSLEELSLYYESSLQYIETKKGYRNKTVRNDSTIIGSADLGLLNAYIHFADSATVMHQFDRLIRSPAADSLKQHGWYMIGQYYLQHTDSIAAIDAFKKIASAHPDYPFAQYSKGICQYQTNDADQLVEKSFKSAIAFPAETPAQHEIVFRARYALGCFYYAKNRFADAQHYLQQIPPFSEVYHDAIAVIGWALFKSRLWGVCREVAEELQKSYNADIKAEGYLLEAYCVFGDTIATPSRRQRLSAVLAITTKARDLLPELNAYRLLETDSERSVIFEQQRQLAHYISAFNESLETTKKRAEQFKRISELKKPFKNISDNMLTGYYAISIAQHYQAIDDRIATIIDDIEYLHNKMRILVERPIPVQEEPPVEQAAERE